MESGSQNPRWGWGGAHSPHWNCSPGAEKSWHFELASAHGMVSHNLLIYYYILPNLFEVSVISDHGILCLYTAWLHLAFICIAAIPTGLQWYFLKWLIDGFLFIHGFNFYRVFQLLIQKVNSLCWASSEKCTNRLIGKFYRLVWILPTQHSHITSCSTSHVIILRHNELMQCNSCQHLIYSLSRPKTFYYCTCSAAAEVVFVCPLSSFSVSLEHLEKKVIIICFCNIAIISPCTNTGVSALNGFLFSSLIVPS